MVYCTVLERLRIERYREFESLILRVEVIPGDSLVSRALDMNVSLKLAHSGLPALAFLVVMVKHLSRKEKSSVRLRQEARRD